MIRTNDQLLTWLKANCKRDRVILNALNTGAITVITHYLNPDWFVHVVSRHGIIYHLTVVKHPVTGDPVRWYRVKENTDGGI